MSKVTSLVDRIKKKKKKEFFSSFPPKEFVAVCSDPSCAWSRRVVIPAEENSSKRKEAERQAMKREHSYGVRGCSGEITLIQTKPLGDGGDDVA